VPLDKEEPRTPPTRDRGDEALPSPETTEELPHVADQEVGDFHSGILTNGRGGSKRSARQLVAGYSSFKLALSNQKAPKFSSRLSVNRVFRAAYNVARNGRECRDQVSSTQGIKHETIPQWVEGGSTNFGGMCHLASLTEL
jgi:hypothetical protein